MKDLIEALTILLKYGNPRNPTNCSHDVLFICIDPALVSDTDRARLAQLGVLTSDSVEFEGGFYSFRYGSC